MSVDGIIGLAVAAALFCAAVGTAIGLAFAAHSRDARTACIRAWAKWRAERLAATRACYALAVAMRAAREFPTARQAILRRDEIRRSRNRWSRALYRLDAAEAMLLALEPARKDMPGSLSRKTQDALASAIDGDRSELRCLKATLLRLDRETRQRFENAVAPKAQRTVRDAVAVVLGTFRSILDHWTRS